MAEFGLVKSFDIDCGELDGLTPQQCFVLGYELSQIDELLKSSPEPFSKTVHSQNCGRIKTSCNDAGRQYRLTWLEGDSSESWMLLEVPAPPIQG